MASLTQEQAAAVAGLTTRRLQQMDKANDGPERSASGGYPADALGRWLRNRVLSELGVANDGEAYDYNAERGRLTKAQADKTELEVAELKGSLIRAQAVSEHWQGMVTSMRAKMLALPGKLAAQIAPADKLQQAQDRSQALVYEALAEIAGDGIPRDVRDRTAAQRRAGSQGDSQTADKDDDKRVGKRKPRAVGRGQRGAG